MGHEQWFPKKEESWVPLQNVSNCKGSYNHLGQHRPSAIKASSKNTVCFFSTITNCIAVIKSTTVQCLTTWSDYLHNPARFSFQSLSRSTYFFEVEGGKLIQHLHAIKEPHKPQTTYHANTKKVTNKKYLVTITYTVLL